MDAYIKCCGGGTPSLAIHFEVNCDAGNALLIFVVAGFPSVASLNFQIFDVDTEEWVTLNAEPFDYPNGSHGFLIADEIGNGEYGLFRVITEDETVISNEEQFIVDCPEPIGPVVALSSIVLDCEEALLHLIITASDLPGGTTYFFFQWSDDNGDTWNMLNGVPIAVTNGTTEVDQGLTLENNTYLFRLISADESILSNNEVELLIDCCDDEFSLVTYNVDCEDDTIDFILNVALCAYPATVQAEYQLSPTAEPDVWANLGFPVEVTEDENPYQLTVPVPVEGSGNYMIRIKVDGEVRILQPITVDCAVLEITGASHDCGTGNMVFDYTITGVGVSYNVAFTVDSTPPRNISDTVGVGSHFIALPGGGDGALPNGTYTITSLINGVAGGEFELIVSCP